MTERWHPDERLPVIARFEVRRRAYLAPDGSINRHLPAFASDTGLLVLYRAMVLVRAFDMKAVALQRTGRLGTYATSLGQEAVSVGTASAMRNEDVLLPSYRDNAALIWRGVKLEEILLFWGGDERGNCFSGPVQDFPFCIPVGSQAPHAAGVAYAFKVRKSRALPYVCSATAPPQRAPLGGDELRRCAQAAGCVRRHRRVPAAHRRRGRALFSRKTAGPRDHVRSPLCRTAEGLCRAAPGTRGERLMPEVTLAEAINLALGRAMEDDPNVVVFGEDVGVNGGVFRATVGLQQRFRSERVFDTPLAELLISGLCVGMAAAAKSLAEAGPAEALRGMRRAMALRMAAAHAEVDPATVVDDADIDEWRTGEDPTVRLMRAFAAACRAEPALNAWYDSGAGARRLVKRIDIGIAIDTEGGLIVPVMRNVAERDARDLRAGLDRLRADAAACSIPPEELRVRPSRCRTSA
jgi:hypothetical protein